MTHNYIMALALIKEEVDLANLTLLKLIALGLSYI